VNTLFCSAENIEPKSLAAHETTLSDSRLLRMLQMQNPGVEKFLLITGHHQNEIHSFGSSICDKLQHGHDDHFFQFNGLKDDELCVFFEILSRFSSPQLRTLE